MHISGTYVSIDPLVWVVLAAGVFAGAVAALLSRRRGP
jgi:hypothetical protein